MTEWLIIKDGAIVGRTAVMPEIALDEYLKKGFDVTKVTRDRGELRTEEYKSKIKKVV